MPEVTTPNWFLVARKIEDITERYTAHADIYNGEMCVEVIFNDDEQPAETIARKVKRYLCRQFHEADERYGLILGHEGNTLWLNIEVPALSKRDPEPRIELLETAIKAALDCEFAQDADPQSPEFMAYSILTVALWPEEGPLERYMIERGWEPEEVFDIRDSLTEIHGGYWYQWSRSEIEEVEAHATEAALDAGGYNFNIHEWYKQHDKTGVPLDYDLPELDDDDEYTVAPEDGEPWMDEEGYRVFFTPREAWEAILEEEGVPAGRYEITSYLTGDVIAVITRPEAEARFAVYRRNNSGIMDWEQVRDTLYKRIEAHNVACELSRDNPGWTYGVGTINLNDGILEPQWRDGEAC